MAYVKESSRSAQTYRPVFTASGLASFLEEESLGENFNSPVLALTNFLNHLCDENEPLTAALINRFYNRALVFSEWQQNFTSLHVATSIAIKNFCDATSFEFSFAEVIDPISMQVIPLDQKKVRERVIEKFLESELSPSDQFRLFEDRAGRTLAILKLQDGSVRAINFPNFGALIDAEVVPLCTEFGLAYNSQLEFSQQTTQNIQLSTHTQARFKVDAQGLMSGAIVRGSNFEPVKIFKRSSLIQEAELFYPVKHLEQFFIDRNSDAVYLELISGLNQAIDMVLTEQPDAVGFAQEILQRSRFAFEQIFPDDKALKVQVQSLERALSVESLWPPINQIHPKIRIELD